VEPTRVEPTRVEPTRVEPLSELDSIGRVQALPTNIRLGCRRMAVANILA
jgi:hypothetical protein